MDKEIDIVPELWEAIESQFLAAVENDPKIMQLYDLLKSGRATYREAQEFAVAVGEHCSDALIANLLSGLPNGRLYYNIATRTVLPALQNEYELVSMFTEEVQNLINAGAGTGLKAIKPKIDTDRLNGLIDKISDAEQVLTVQVLLRDGPVNFAQHIVDQSVQENADLYNRAGREAIITRITAGGCCKWCRTMSGKYKYEDVPKDVYRRHENCRCEVLFEAGNGTVQNVHTKKIDTRSIAEHEKELESKIQKTAQKGTALERLIESRIK